MLKASQPENIPENGIDFLKTEDGYRIKLQEIGNKIHAARDLDDILTGLKDEILSIFAADRMTLFVIDGVKRELVSRFKSGDEIAEIRIPVSKGSVVGYSALTHQLLNISDVHDDQELQSIDEELCFDKSWDQKTGYRTRQVMAYPIIFQKYLMGTLQLVNCKKKPRFSEEDEKAIVDLSKIIGIALYNQKRMAARGGRATKFDYLLENHLLTQKELGKALIDARQRKETVENILINEYKIPKTEMGESLGRYYKVPFVAFNNTHPSLAICWPVLKFPLCAIICGSPCGVKIASLFSPSMILTI